MWINIFLFLCLINNVSFCFIIKTISHCIHKNYNHSMWMNNKIVSIWIKKNSFFFVLFTYWITSLDSHSIWTQLNWILCMQNGDISSWHSFCSINIIECITIHVNRFYTYNLFTMILQFVSVLRVYCWVLANSAFFQSPISISLSLFIFGFSFLLCVVLISFVSSTKIH